jgi:hypothetical protein
MTSVIATAVPLCLSADTVEAPVLRGCDFFAVPPVTT